MGEISLFEKTSASRAVKTQVHCGGGRRRQRTVTPPLITRLQGWQCELRPGRNLQRHSWASGMSKTPIKGAGSEGTLEICRCRWQSCLAEFKVNLKVLLPLPLQIKHHRGHRGPPHCFLSLVEG